MENQKTFIDKHCDRYNHDDTNDDFLKPQDMSLHDIIWSAYRITDTADEEIVIKNINTSLYFNREEIIQKRFGCHHIVPLPHLDEVIELRKKRKEIKKSRLSMMINKQPTVIDKLDDLLLDLKKMKQDQTDRMDKQFHKENPDGYWIIDDIWTLIKTYLDFKPKNRQFKCGNFILRIKNQNWKQWNLNAGTHHKPEWIKPEYGRRNKYWNIMGDRGSDGIQLQIKIHSIAKSGKSMVIQTRLWDTDENDGDRQNQGTGDFSTKKRHKIVGKNDTGRGNEVSESFASKTGGLRKRSIPIYSTDLEEVPDFRAIEEEGHHPW